PPRGSGPIAIGPWPEPPASVLGKAVPFQAWCAPPERDPRTAPEAIAGYWPLSVPAGVAWSLSCPAASDAWSGKPTTIRRPARRRATPKNTGPATDGSTSCVLRPQHVTLTPASQDQRRVEPLVDLVPQITDVDIDDVRRIFVVFVVQMFPNHRASHHLAAVEGQVLEQAILPRRQVDRLTGAFHRASG